MIKILKKNKRIIFLVTAIIVLFFIVKIAVYYSNIFHLNKIGYSFDVAKIIYKSEYYDYIKNNNYSEIVEKYINDDNFNSDYIEKYYKINYVDIDDFIIVINSLINKEYLEDDINNIITNYDKSLVSYLLDNKVDDISKYLEFEFFNSEKIDRYIKYFNGDYKDTIVKVNIGLDKNYYEDPNIITKFSIDMIVNKYNKLSSDFVPDNLTKLSKCSMGDEYLSIEAKEAFDKMCDASKSAGLSLGVTSSYRSYESQEKVYNSYLRTNGKNYVEKYVATPGFSEHQTGLALDVKSLYSSPFKTTKEYRWMIENSYKYGFILRYPEEKENLTGYNPEAWHFRYVGESIATFIHDNNVTYEEYYAMYK